MDRRRQGRPGVATVIHRHLAGDIKFCRVSELALIDGRPKAILGWVNVGGLRTPIYICELDPAKLRRSKSNRNLYYYDDVTVDPRYADMAVSTTSV